MQPYSPNTTGFAASGNLDEQQRVRVLKNYQIKKGCNLQMNLQQTRLASANIYRSKLRLPQSISFNKNPLAGGVPDATNQGNLQPLVIV